MPTILSDLLKPALRRGGITTLPNTTPSTDQTGELIPEVNRMLASRSLDGHKVFTTAISTHALVTDQQSYTIGPAGDFNVARPLFIQDANYVLPSDPAVRHPIRVYDSHEFSLQSIRELSGAPPWVLYYDNGLNSSGQGKIYLIGQPPNDYELELFTWTALASSFTAISDAALFPPGYEDAIVAELACRVVKLYPKLSALAKDSVAKRELRDEAKLAWQGVVTLNSRCPALKNEAAGVSAPESALSWGWWL